MGTTRLKVIDLSSGEKEIKTARKHAAKIALKQHDKETKIPETASNSEAKKHHTTQNLTDQITSKSNGDTEQSPVPTAVAKKSKSAKPHKHHFGRKYQMAKQEIEDKAYNTTDAFEILPKTSFVKFDPSVEIHLAVSDKNLKGKINFPNPYLTIKKSKKYLIFTDKKFETKEAVIWATEKTVKEIEAGEIKPGKDFDTVITSPKFMPHLAKVAKILGPKGLMPNPKNGTITDDPQKIMGSSSDDSVHYKTDPTAPIIHLKLGKLSQKSEELRSNLKTAVTTIGPSKIKRATLTTSMGPSIRLDIASI